MKIKRYRVGDTGGSGGGLPPFLTQTHTDTHTHSHTHTHTHTFLRCKKEKGKQREKRKTFKAETIKKLLPRKVKVLLF